MESSDRGLSAKNENESPLVNLGSKKLSPTVFSISNSLSDIFLFVEKDAKLKINNLIKKLETTLDQKNYSEIGKELSAFFYQCDDQQQFIIMEAILMEIANNTKGLRYNLLFSLFAHSGINKIKFLKICYDNAYTTNKYSTYFSFVKPQDLAKFQLPVEEQTDLNVSLSQVIDSNLTNDQKLTKLVNILEEKNTQYGGNLGDKLVDLIYASTNEVNRMLLSEAIIQFIGKDKNFAQQFFGEFFSQADSKEKIDIYFSFYYKLLFGTMYEDIFVSEIMTTQHMILFRNQLSASEKFQNEIRLSVKKFLSKMVNQELAESEFKTIRLVHKERAQEKNPVEKSFLVHSLYEELCTTIISCFLTCPQQCSDAYINGKVNALTNHIKNSLVSVGNELEINIYEVIDRICLNEIKRATNIFFHLQKLSAAMKEELPRLNAYFFLNEKLKTLTEYEVFIDKNPSAFADFNEFVINAKLNIENILKNPKIINKEIIGKVKNQLIRLEQIKAELVSKESVKNEKNSSGSKDVISKTEIDAVAEEATQTFLKVNARYMSIVKDSPQKIKLIFKPGEFKHEIPINLISNAEFSVEKLSQVMDIIENFVKLLSDSTNKKIEVYAKYKEIIVAEKKTPPAINTITLKEMQQYIKNHELIKNQNQVEEDKQQKKQVQKLKLTESKLIKEFEELKLKLTKEDQSGIVMENKNISTRDTLDEGKKKLADLTSKIEKLKEIVSKK